MIIDKFPPNYSQIVEALGDISAYKPIFAVYPHIYNPFKREITPDIKHHEEVHLKEQAKFTSPEIYYTQYLNDSDFRFEQEIIAYGSQYAFGKRYVKNNKLLSAFLDSLAFELSSEAYGKLVKFAEARSKINNFAKQINA